jgi:beta-phosphoglucomutase-like phosphatase (HAD superfamily)/dTDP-glucose pyrophosphorylase
MQKLIIFDLDGTLIDSKTIHFDAFNRALEELDPNLPISLEDQKNIYEGLPTTEKLKILTKRKQLDESLYGQIWDTKQKYTMQMLENVNKDEELIDIFKYIKENNIKIAVASNSVRKTIDFILDRLGILEYVDYIVGNDEVINPKPHPEMYWKCMSFFATIPEDTIIFEDSIVGKIAVHDSKVKLIDIKSRNDINKNLIKESVTYLLNKKNEVFGKKINVLIPMAGAGSRFSKAGYTFPKPLIEVMGKTMIQTVVDNLSIDANYIFIVQKTHYENYNLKDMLNLIAPNCTIVQVDGVTDGAAATTLLAEKYINNNCPLIIANSDQYIKWDAREFLYDVLIKNVDGAILLFNSTHPKWSYVKINNFGFISEVAEKKVISNNATVGIYYWKHGADYIKYTKQMIDKNIRINNEFYVCPVYNEAIDDGKKILPSFVEKMWGLGTPEDLDMFIKENM